MPSPVIVRKVIVNQPNPAMLLEELFAGNQVNGSKWTKTDTGNHITVSGGNASWDGGTGAWADSALVSVKSWARLAGLTIEWEITPGATNTEFLVGFTDGSLAANAAEAHGIYFKSTGIISVIVNAATGIVTPLAYTAVSTWAMIVCKATGAYYYISTNNRVTWDLIWIDSSVTVATLYAFIESYDAALTASACYVSLGSVKPPVISTTPAAPTLTLGAELLTNGNMETGSPPSSWSGVSATLTAQADERTGGSGSQSLDIARNGVDTAYARQTLAVSAGAWVIVSAWRRKVNGQVADINLRDDTSVFFNSADYTSTTWAQLVAAARVTGTNAHIRLIAYSTLADGTSSRFDDVSVKPLPFDTTGSLVYLGEHGQHNGIYSVNPTITALYQAGVVVHANSVTAPTYCLHGYMDRTLAKAYLVKIVAGVTTELTSGSITYSAGAALEIISNGTQHGLYYNKALVGSMQTLDVSSNYGLSMFGFQTLATDSLGLSEAHV